MKVGLNMKHITLVKLPYASFNDYLGNHSGVPTRQAYLAAVLEKAGIEYDILDLNIISIDEFGLSDHNRFLSYLSTPKSKVDYFLKSRHKREKLRYMSWIRKKVEKAAKGSDFIGINGDKAWLALDILRMAKRANPDVKTIVGGRKATDSPHIFLSKGFTDYICQSYADNSIPGIIKGRKDDIPNVIKADGGRQLIRPYTFDIKEVLSPSYEKIRLRSYFRYFSYTGIISSFGCRNHCPFCNYHGGAFTIRRPHKDTLDEIQMFSDRFGIRNFIFLDSCINNDKRHIAGLADAMIKNRSGINWQAMFQAGGMDIGLATSIARAGCIFGTFGIETPNQRLQKRIGKKIDIIRAKAILKTFNSLDIMTRITLMYDLPGETFRDFVSSLRFVNRTGVDFFEFHKLRLHPNTMMHDSSDLYFPNTFRDNGIIERIRSRREVLELALKDFIARHYRLSNRKRFDRTGRLNDFSYTRRYRRIMRI